MVRSDRSGLLSPREDARCGRVAGKAERRDDRRGDAATTSTRWFNRVGVIVRIRTDGAQIDDRKRTLERNAQDYVVERGERNARDGRARFLQVAVVNRTE